MNDRRSNLSLMRIQQRSWLLLGAHKLASDREGS